MKTRVFATGRNIASADLPAELDVLVNAAWGGYETMFENDEFAWARGGNRQDDGRFAGRRP